MPMKLLHQSLFKEFHATWACYFAVACLGFASVAARAEPPPAQLTEALNKYIYQHITDVVYNDPFRFALEDLNGDGRADAIVLMSGPRWCGSGGCTMIVFQGVEDGFEFVSSSTVTSAPIRVLRKTTHGWRSLIVYSKKRGNVLIRFNGDVRYPGNPSMQPKASQADVNAASIAIE